MEQELKIRFTKQEVEALRQPQQEPFRFLIETAEGKPVINAYRLHAEDGIRYCNRVANQFYEKEKGILTLKIMGRGMEKKREWIILGRIQRNETGEFDLQSLFELQR